MKIVFTKSHAFWSSLEWSKASPEVCIALLLRLSSFNFKPLQTTSEPLESAGACSRDFVLLRGSFSLGFHQKLTLIKLGSKIDCFRGNLEIWQFLHANYIHTHIYEIGYNVSN